MPGDGVTCGDHDRSGGVAVEPDDASGRKGGSHGHATDVHVVACRGETPRGGKEEDYEDRDGRNCNEPQHMNPWSLHKPHHFRRHRAAILKREREDIVQLGADRPTMPFTLWSRARSQQGPNRLRAIRCSMKAARLFSYDKPLKVVDVDAPRIKNPSEVLVRVTGAGVCHTDLHIVEGVWREKVQVTLPYTLGHENAGVVQEVGDAVTSFKKGEKVIVHPVITDGTCRPCRIGEDMHCENLVFPGITADGGFAEVLRTSERSLVRIHDLAPDDVAPLADAGLTAIRAVKKAASRTTSGSNVVVMGVGGLGHIALQLLRCMTNAVIIAADVAESKLRLAEKMGAHRVVDARRDPVKQVMDITGNRGADVVIDLVGNDLTLANGMKMLHKGGTLIIVGYGGTLSVKAIDVIFSEFSVLGSLVGNWDELRELMELTRQGKVRVITQKGKLDEVNDILDQLKKGTLEGRGVVIP